MNYYNEILIRIYLNSEIFLKFNKKIMLAEFLQDYLSIIIFLIIALVLSIGFIL